MNEVKVQRNYKDTIFRMLFKDKEDLYSSKLIRIPSPRFVVFYNGTDTQPERQTLKLSDSYEKEQENPKLELTVTVYNINFGFNEEIMDACRTLKEYAMYVKRVRTYAKQMPLTEAVEKAVDECISAGILLEFLKKNRAEAIKVSIYEYDEELHFKTLYEEGHETGLARGLEQGERRLADLLQKLIDTGRSEDVSRAISDPEYRKQLYLENV